MTDLIPQALTEEQIPTAFPLARMAEPGLDLAGWIVRAKALIGRRERGIVALRAPSGVLQALAGWRVEADARIGRRLSVEPFVAFELGRKGVARDALWQELEALARRHGCDALQFAGTSRGLFRRPLAEAS